MTELYGLGYSAGGYAPLTEAEEVPAATPSATPRLSLLVDWVHDINPAEELPDPTWTELVSYVRAAEGFSLNRGRARTLDRNEAGTFSVLLGDPDGDLDPDNPDSPFFPNVVPMRRIRAVALTDSDYDPFVTGSTEVGGEFYVGGGAAETATVIFDGLIEGFRYDYPGPGRDAVVRIQATDWLGALARERFTFDMFSVLSNPEGDPLFDEVNSAVRAVRRIHMILNRKPFATRRAFEDPGYADTSRLVLTLNYDDAVMLSSVQDPAEIDGGNFYATRDGAYRYRGPEDQYAPLDERLRVEHGVQEFADIEFVYDESVIYNDIRISTDNFGVQTFTDDASVSRYFQRTKSYSLPFVGGSDVTARGEELLLRYAQPRRVIQKLDMSNLVTDWATWLGTDLWDKVLVTVVLPSGDTFTQLSLIEGIEVSSPNHRDWRFGLWLSPAPFRNLLSDEQAYFETGIAGWNAETNCTIAQSDKRSQGQHGLRIEALTEADVSVRTDSVAVEPRVQYHASLKASAAIYGELFGNWDAHMELEWRDSSDALLSTLVGETVAVSGSTVVINPFRLLAVSGRSPAAAAYARLRVVVEDLPEPNTTGPGGTVEQGAFIDDAHLNRI